MCMKKKREIEIKRLNIFRNKNVFNSLIKMYTCMYSSSMIISYIMVCVLVMLCMYSCTDMYT